MPVDLWGLGTHPKIGHCIMGHGLYNKCKQQTVKSSLNHNPVYITGLPKMDYFATMADILTLYIVNSVIYRSSFQYGPKTK